MAQPQVFEGTPEQLTQWLRQRQNGKRYRIVEVEDEEKQTEANPAQSVQASPQENGAAKQLLGRGMLAGILSTEDYLRRKHEDATVKKLSGFGKFAHVPGGSEAFALEKQKEIEREDKKFD